MENEEKENKEWYMRGKVEREKERELEREVEREIEKVLYERRDIEEREIEKVLKRYGF